MAQRHSVYLKRSAAAITPEEVLKSITEVEWDLVAQACEVPEKWIAEADENLRVENDGGTEFRRYHLYYRSGDERPLMIERRATQEQIDGAIGRLSTNSVRKRPPPTKCDHFWKPAWTWSPRRTVRTSPANRWPRSSLRRFASGWPSDWTVSSAIRAGTGTNRPTGWICDRCESEFARIRVDLLHHYGVGPR